MDLHLPFSALLSQSFVAFTIEFDNEFEHRVPHRTTNYGATPGYPRAPWLVSMAMWTRFMQYIPLEGISIGELQGVLNISNKGLRTWLTRLSKWWSYLSFQPPLGPGSSRRLPAETVVVPTNGGGKAIEVWATLTPMLEQRWRERFGVQSISSLEKTLRAIAGQLDPALPRFFAVLEYEDAKRRPQPTQDSRNESTLPQLLARLLLAFAHDFDRESIAPLQSCANVLRVTRDEGTRVRDLSQLTFLSVDGVAAAIRQLVRGRYATLKSDAASRSKIVVLTSKGKLARDRYVSHDGEIEGEWKKRFGVGLIKTLRNSLEELSGSDKSGEIPLLGGVAPFNDGWRASLPPPQGLPYFPLITHRGGFPDGS
jgi:hypothetical protein